MGRTRFIMMVIAAMFFIGCQSCGGNSIVPGSMRTANGADIYPVVYGLDTDHDGKDENMVVAYDTATTTYTSPVQIGTDDILQGMWNSQRGGLVVDADGSWGFVTIEDTSYDLEYWLCDDPRDVDTWSLVDDDTTNDYWILDALAFKGNIHTMTITTALDVYCGIVQQDTSTITIYDPNITEAEVDYLTITYDWYLNSWWIGFELCYFGLAHDYKYEASTQQYLSLEAYIISYPKILTDSHNNVWLIYLNSLQKMVVDLLPDVNTLTSLTTDYLKYEVPVDLSAGTETILTYDAVCNYNDNTLHVVTMEYLPAGGGGEPAEVYLNYYRRDFNGWSDPVQLDTWIYERGEEGDQLTRNFVQIGIDENYNIYIFVDKFLGDPDLIGDLQRWFLPMGEYEDYTNGGGEWAQTTNLDASSNDVLWCQSIGNHPGY